jgi:hypothetical protein
MRETRRTFVLALAAAASSLAAPQPLLFAQRRGGFPTPPQPAEKQNPAAIPNDANRASAKALLQENEREFRAGIERLYQLTSELRDEVQKTATSEILSLRIYKKTEEIEKLAKQLKNKVKG